MDNYYFSLDEDFEKIIKESLRGEKIKKLDFISTGWTNIVYEVKTEKETYFFRFPRDEFWSRTIIKDYEFSKYIKGKTSFNTCELELFYHKKRPYSRHRKIPGVALAEVMNKLDKKQVKEVSKSISQFMYELHNLEYTSEDIFKESKDISFNLRDYLKELLTTHVQKSFIKTWNKQVSSLKETNNSLVHGDLNSSNVLLNDKHEVIAFIDFGFGGFGDKYDDISRIIGRLPNTFKETIISSYDNLDSEKLNLDILNKKIYMWDNIDKSYIDYMRKIGIYK